MPTVVGQFTIAAEPDADIREEFSFGSTDLSRTLTWSGEAEHVAGGGSGHTVSQSISLEYERIEASSGNPPDTSFQDDEPAVKPWKSYRVTIEEM